VVSHAIKARVIQQFLEGYSLNESLASLHKFLRRSSIGNYRQDFIRYEEELETRLGPDLGLKTAAEDWGVTKTVDRLVRPPSVAC